MALTKFLIKKSFYVYMYECMQRCACVGSGARVCVCVCVWGGGGGGLDELKQWKYYGIFRQSLY